jgi:hypothetical protein
MSSTYSSSLRIELIGSGDQAGAWGATTDNSFAYVFDTAIAGYQAVPITSTSQALTYVNGATATANLNQAVYAMLKFTGASAATSVYIPPSSKQYIVWNNTSYAITVYNSTVIGNTTAAGTGITLAAADKILIWSDGTNVYDVKAQGLTGTLAIANGGTGQTTQQAAINALAGTQTNNRVLRSDGTNTTLSQVALTTDVTGTLPVTNGGTGQTTAQSAMNAFAGAVTSGSYLRGNGTNVVMSTIQAADVPTLNQNTSGTAAGLSTTLAIASGGTGQTTANAALNALLPAQTNNRLLKSNGTNTSFAQASLTTDVTGTLPVTNGGTGTTTSTGSGNTVLSTSPTLVTPFLGTPQSGNLAYCTFPTLNQNTTGTAAGLSTTLAVASGGTGQTTAANAGSAFGAIGVGQTWQDVTASRALGTTYTNSTGRPIMFSVSATGNGGFIQAVLIGQISGVTVITNGANSGTAGGATYASFTLIVPSGSSYNATNGNGCTLQTWFELS